MIPKEKNMNECRIETKEEIEAYLAKLRYALEHGAELTIQMERKVDNDREIQYTNRYTIADLFPNENPYDAIKRAAFVMSFHYAMHPFEVEMFPYRKQEGIA